MHTSEMRAYEMAIEKTLQSDFYDADQTEIDNFINSVRTFLVRKVEITPEEPENVPEFPTLLAPGPLSKAPLMFGSRAKPKVEAESDEALILDVSESCQ